MLRTAFSLMIVLGFLFQSAVTSLARSPSAADTAGNSAPVTGSVPAVPSGDREAACLTGACSGSPADGSSELPGSLELPSSTVLLHNGGLVYRVPVVTLTGPGDSDIDLFLTYHSQSGAVGALGEGWSFSYGMHVQPYDDPLPAGVEITYPDGQAKRFAKQPDGKYLPVDPANHDVLEETATGWLLSRPGLVRYTFDSSGRLESILDRNNNAVRLTYEAGLLTRIRNEGLREVALGYIAYGEHGLLASISAPDGRQFAFGYEDGLLTSFTNSSGGMWRFLYETRPTRLDGETQAQAAHQLAAVIAPTGDEYERLEYDSQGKVTRLVSGGQAERTFAYAAGETNVTDAYGNTTTYIYDGMGRLVERVDADGLGEIYEYDSHDNRVSLRDRAGRVWAWTYDAMGNRLSESGPLGVERTWAYNDLGLVVAETQSGPGVEPRSWTYTYTPQGNLLTETDPLGNQRTWRYDERGLPTRTTDFSGEIYYNSFDNRGSLTATINRLFERTGFYYDDSGRVTTRILPEGQQYHYTYDGEGHLLAVDGPLGYHLGFTYDASGRLAAATDAGGAVTRYERDAAGAVVRVTGPLGDETTYSYGMMGELTGKRDALGHEWQYAYDSLLRLVEERSPDGNVTRRAYDAAGNLVETTDAAGRVLRTEWDALDRPVAVIQNFRPGETPSAEINVTSGYAYDAYGNLIRSVDPLGNVTEYGYDLLGRRTSVRAPGGQVWMTAYNAIGHITSETDPLGAVTAFAYDASHRLVSVTGPLGAVERTAYDRNGNPVSETDALGVVTRRAYDALDRPVSVTLNYQAGAAASADVNVTSTFTYDLAGRLLTSTNPLGFTTSFAYDAAGRLVREQDALGNAWDYTYDAAGNRTARRDANGQATIYGYTNTGRLSEVRYADGSAVTFAYDANGNLVEMADGLGVSTWTYDGLDRVSNAVDALGRATTFVYDAGGNRTALVLPDGGQVRYRFDASNRLEAMTDPAGRVTTYTRDAAGQVTGISYPNGMQAALAYDLAGQVISVANTARGKTSSAFDYTYNAAGLPVEITSRYAWRKPERVTEQRSYDALGRLVAAETAGRSNRYVYDAAGNRLAWSVDGESTAYAYDAADRLVEATRDEAVTRFWYDANGNRIGQVTHGSGPDRGVTYTYDPENRLAGAFLYQVTGSKGQQDRGQAAMLYDGLGRRMVRAEGQNRTEYAYDGLDIIAEYSGGKRSELYRGEGGSLVALQKFPAGNDATALWYQLDGLGSVAGVSKQDGQAVHNYRYDPFGLLLPEQGNFTEPHNSYTYLSKPLDPLTGLYDFGPRSYDPQTGAWLTPLIRSRTVSTRNSYAFRDYTAPVGKEGVGAGAAGSISAAPWLPESP